MKTGRRLVRETFNSMEDINNYIIDKKIKSKYIVNIESIGGTGIRMYYFAVVQIENDKEQGEL